MDETGIRKELDGFFASAKNPNEVTGWYLALRDWAKLRFQDACALKLGEKNWDNAAFDSKAIVECANSRQVNTPQELASKLGLPLDGPLKRRLHCLATVDGLISMRFLAYAQGSRP